MFSDEKLQQKRNEMAGYVMYLEFKDIKGVIWLEGIGQNVYRFPPFQPLGKARRPSF